MTGKLMPGVVYIAPDLAGELVVAETAAQLDWVDGDGRAGKYMLCDTGRLEKGSTRFVKDE